MKRKSKLHKLLSLLLALVMIISAVPLSGISVFAAESGDFEYRILENGTAEITGYSGDAIDLVIPSEIDGYKVSSIGYRAFTFCSFVNVVISEGITEIGYNAFQNCGLLTSITIPDSVINIRAYAFEYCFELESIMIPRNVVEIEKHSFLGCYALTDIIVSPDNEQYCDIDGVLFSKDQKEIILYPQGRSGDYKIPDSVTTIGSSAFENCSLLTSITIPESVTYIGLGAFESCTSVTHITIPESITSIESSTFRNCTSLTNITIPESVTYIGGSAFENCTSFTHITIPEGVTAINYYTFANCSALKKINIPDSVSSIGEGAFYKCYLLENITLPDSITLIENVAFADCSSMKSVTIPDSVREIGLAAFGMHVLLGGKSISSSSDIYDENDHMIGFKIYGFNDTAASRYADKYNFEFIPLDKKTDSATGISITEKELNIIPDGAELKIDKLSSAANKMVVDISLVKDAAEVQPNGEVTVKIPLPQGMNPEICKVYREEVDSTFTDMNAYYLSGYGTDNANGYMVFTTDHFSRYVITTTDPSVSISGDINGDGKVTAVDARWLLQIAAGTREVTEDERISVDLNGDGKVTAVDARRVLQIAAGTRVL